MKNFWIRVFSTKKNNGTKKGGPKRRDLRLESLEDRQLLAVTAGALVGAAPMPTGAEEPSVVVTTLEDVVDDSDGLISLREAVTQYAASGDTITFDASLDGGTITLGGSQIYIAKGLSIDASDLSNGITVNANSQSRVFWIHAGSISAPSDVTIKNLTISGGGSVNLGAGVYVETGNITLDSCVVSMNTAGERGGGIYSRGSLTSITNGTVVEGNHAKYGGGIYGYSNPSENPMNYQIQIIDSEVIENTVNYSGGGVYASCATIINSVISGNHAVESGGGIYFHGSAYSESNFNRFKMTITGSTIGENKVTGDYSRGGGIYIYAHYNSTIMITDSEIEVNTANYGGGIYNGNSILTLDGTAVSGNKALASTLDGAGGGLYNDRTAYILNDCMFTGNRATNFGGGVFNSSGSNAKITITESKFYSNHAEEGAGLYNHNVATLKGVEFSSNIATGRGGAICNRGSSFILTSSDNGVRSSLSGNKADNGAGLVTTTIVKISNTDFTHNVATNEGGALNLTGGPNNVIAYCVFMKNEALDGGAVRIGGTTSISNCEFDANIAHSRGGAIYNGSKAFTVENSTFVKNVAKYNESVGDISGQGGAIFNIGGDSSTQDTTLFILNCELSQNSADTNGGAFCNAGRIVEMTDCVMTENTANFGGAVFGSSSITLTNCDATYNSAARGGAIYNKSLLKVTGGEYSHNSAKRDTTTNEGGLGGAFFSSYQTTISDCVINNNNAYEGGGILIYGDGTISGCSMSENAASARGGALFAGFYANVTVNDVVTAGGETTYKNFTFTNNTATKAGGAICSYGNTTITPSEGGASITFSGNSAAGGGAIFNSGENSSINAVQFLNNKATSFDGGAIYNTHFYQYDDITRIIDLIANLTVTDSSFTGNTSAASGGAIDNWGNMTISSCAFSENTTANNGGAVHNGNFLKGYNYVKTEISDTRFTTTLDVSESTFESNTATFGGAMMNSGTLTLDSCDFGGVGKGNTATGDGTGGALSIGIDGNVTFQGTNSFVENSAYGAGAFIVGGDLVFDDGAMLTLTDNSITCPDPDYGANILYNKAKTEDYPEDWSIYINGDAETECEKIKPFKYTQSASSPLTQISASKLFADQATASDDAVLYLDVDGSGNFVEVGKSFSAAQLGLTSGESEMNFLYVTGSGSIGGTLKLNVGDATPEISSVASAGVNRHQIAWSAIDGAKGYELAFSTDQENWSSVMTSGTAYTVSGLTYGEKVYYKVRGTSGDLSSSWSALSSLVICPMDINGDGLISSADFTALSMAMNSKRGDSRWDARCDVNGDGIVSASDLTYISMNWLSRSTSEKLTFPTAAAEVADVTALDLDLSFVDEDADAEDSLFEAIF